jgi:hypothetical protein
MSTNATPGERPRAVTKACYMLLASGGLQCLSDAFWKGDIDGPLEWIIKNLIFISLWGFFALKVFEGRNWARITVLLAYLPYALPKLFWTILFICSVVIDPSEPVHDPLKKFVAITSDILIAWALVLIFFPPGSRWFARRPGSVAA